MKTYAHRLTMEGTEYLVIDGLTCMVIDLSDDSVNRQHCDFAPGVDPFDMSVPSSALTVFLHCTCGVGQEEAADDTCIHVQLLRLHRVQLLGEPVGKGKA